MGRSGARQLNSEDGAPTDPVCLPDLWGTPASLERNKILDGQMQEEWHKNVKVSDLNWCFMFFSTLCKTNYVKSLFWLSLSKEVKGFA